MFTIKLTDHLHKNRLLFKFLDRATSMIAELEQEKGFYTLKKQKGSSFGSQSKQQTVVSVLGRNNYIFNKAFPRTDAETQFLSIGIQAGYDASFEIRVTISN